MPQIYKKIIINGKTMPLHRYVFEQAHGPIPAGLLVHHINHDKMDNRLANLALMTPQAHSEHHNQKHAVTRKCNVCGVVYAPHPTKRARSKTCSRDCFKALAGKACGQSKGTAKLDDDKVREIRRRVAAGEPQSAMCREFGLTPGPMSMMVNRKTWTHVE